MATIVAKFVHHLSADDLHKYFSFRGIDTASVDWNAADALLHEAATELINVLPEPIRRTVFVDTEAVLGLANDAGHRAMLDAVARDRDAMLTAFEDINSGQGRALWLFMNDPEAFKRAGLVCHCDQLRAGRSWDGFMEPPGASFSLSQEALSAFADACAEAYRKIDGFRGVVKFESFGRLTSWKDEGEAGSVTQITIYTEDWPQSFRTFEGDDLERQIVRPASEVHITYGGVDRTIDIVAKGGKSIRREIVRLFACHLLGIDCKPERIVMREISLSVLVDRSALTVDVRSSIARVELKTVRFQPFDGESHYKQFGKRRHAIYDDFDGGRLEIPGYEIDRAELIFEFYPEAGQRRGARVSVILTCPNGCSVKDQGQLHRPGIEEFLERSGIYRASDVGDDEQIEAAE